MSTTEPRRPRSELARLGKELIEQRIQPNLTGEYHNQFVAVDVASGDSELDRDDYMAVTRLRDRRPSAEIWLGRVGQPAAYRMRRGQ